MTRPLIVVPLPVTMRTPLSSASATTIDVEPNSPASVDPSRGSVRTSREYSPGATPLMVNVPSGDTEPPPEPNMLVPCRVMTLTNEPAAGRPCESRTVPLTRVRGTVDSANAIAVSSASDTVTVCASAGLTVPGWYVVAKPSVMTRGSRLDTTTPWLRSDALTT